MSSYLYHIMYKNNSDTILRNIESEKDVIEYILPYVIKKEILEGGIRIIKTDACFEDLFNNNKECFEYRDLFDHYVDVASDIITKTKEELRRRNNDILNLNKRT